MDSEKREKAIDRLKKVLDSLISERPSAYERCLDITEKLFGKTGVDNKGVVLVMNRRDYSELGKIWHHQDCLTVIDGDLGISRKYQTLHGECDYVILDDGVKGMYGYLICT